MVSFEKLSAPTKSHCQTPATLSFDKPASTKAVSSDCLQENGRISTCTTGFEVIGSAVQVRPLERTKVQLSSVSNISQSRGALRSYYLLIHSRKDKLKSHRTIKLFPFSTRVHHHPELSGESFLHREFTQLSRSIHRDGEITPKLWNILSHGTLVDRCDHSNNSLVGR